MTIREFLGGYSRRTLKTMIMSEDSDIIASLTAVMDDQEDDGLKILDRLGDRMIKEWFISYDGCLCITVFGGRF